MNANPILISNPTNIRYLTGFAGLSPTEREAYVLLVADRIYLFTNALYREEANECKVKNEKCIIVEISRDHPFSRELASVCEKESIQKLDFEETNLTVSEFETLKQTLTRTTLIHSNNRIESKRMIKTPDEIVYMRQAAALTDECFSHILTQLKPGVYEADIASEIGMFFKRRGAGNAFPPIVAFGKHTSMPHYGCEGNGGTLQKNDIVLIDFGATVHGYCADMTRMVFLGKPDDVVKRAYTTLLSAQLHALSLLEQGERHGNILDSETRSVLEKQGLPSYPHSLGHALGLDIHESPRLYTDIDSDLQPNMVITIEPGVYMEGAYGMRIEDTIRITETGSEILTRTPKEILVI